MIGFTANQILLTFSKAERITVEGALVLMRASQAPVHMDSGNPAISLLECLDRQVVDISVDPQSNLQIGFSDEHCLLLLNDSMYESFHLHLGGKSFTF